MQDDKNDLFPNDTVYIIDSYGLIFRCYFAFISRPLINSKGDNVSAIFGFFRNLYIILDHYKPSYLFAAMDSKTKTFRHNFYSEYKATRPKVPEDLHAQIPWIQEILEMLNIPVLQCDGYEADDIIATVAKKCEETGRECRILSADKDLMQLVTEKTKILKPDAASTWKITGIDGVKAEWGVEPVQLLDLLSLYGDSADNIPGVRGIGVKTASKLLCDYGDLDGIYNHIEDLKGAVKQKLIDGKETAYFSQKLVRLDNCVPCPEIENALNASPCKFNFASAAEKLFSYDVPSVAKQYMNLAKKSGFSSGTENSSSFQADLFSVGKVADSKNGEEQENPAIVKNSGNYRAVKSVSELSLFIDNVLSSPKKAVAFDCETDGLNTLEAKILGFSLSFNAGEAIYVPLYSNNMFEMGEFISKEEGFFQLKRLFSSEITVVFHNGKFDYKVLRSNGLLQSEFDFEKCVFFDTMIAFWLINPERNGKNGYSLETLAESILRKKGIEFEEIVGKNQTFADVELENAVPYAAEDADFTFQLYEILLKQLKEQNLCDLFFDIEMKILPILAEMELDGVHIDKQILYDYNKELTVGIENIENEIYKEVGHNFNIASPKQLQTVLFEERKLKPGKKTKTGYSTDTSVLEDLSMYDSVPKMILEFRELSKLQSTYVETLPTLCDKNERIHTDFIQTGTATGRLSCHEPNLQNIPIRSDAGRKIRSAFTAPSERVLISADYSQIELVVLAHLSGDKNMCRAFIDGIDVHKLTASLIYGVSMEEVTSEMRRSAKTINFGVIYGMSAFRLASSLGISRAQATTFIQNYFTMYSDIHKFIKDTIAFAEKNGYVETIFGRHRQVLNINSRNKIEKSAAERIAVNTPIQGSSADIVKKSMIDACTALKQSGLRSKLLLQVHDELILECPDDSEIINKTISLVRDKMENAVKLSIPLRVSIEHGYSWGEFH